MTPLSEGSFGEFYFHRTKLLNLDAPQEYFIFLSGVSLRKIGRDTKS